MGHRLGDHFRAVIVASPDSREEMHYTKATEPERVGSPDTHLLILLGRKREWISDAAMPTVGSNLALDTANP